MRKKVFWWRPNDCLNAGDELSFTLVKSILNATGTNVYTSSFSKQLFCIGSVLHFAKTGSCIWGTGLNGKVSKDKIKFETLDVRAVRGPLTQKFLIERGIDVPNVFGDPGILVPYFYPKSLFLTQNDPKPLLIPHFREDLTKIAQPSGFELGTAKCTAEEFISQIVNASEVVTGSLHGLIIAHAYGIPAKLVLPSSDETEFKYLDYAQGIGLSNLKIYENYVNAASMETINFRTPDNVKDELLEHFPIDIVS